MARPETITQRNIHRHRHHTTTPTIDEEESYDDDDISSKDGEIYNRNSVLGGSEQRNNPSSKKKRVSDAKWVEEWNRIYLMVCAASLFVDPLFAYPLSISMSNICLFIDGWFAVTVTVLRCMTDMFHFLNMFLQKRTFSNRGSYNTKRGSRIRGFILNLLVTLPMPQIALWVVIPVLLEKGLITLALIIYFIVFIVQYIPKVYHAACVMRRMHNLNDYIFGTVWWGSALNLIGLFLVSHIVGAFWYLLGLERVMECLGEKCGDKSGCGPKILSCKQPLYFGINNMLKDQTRMAWSLNTEARSTCLEDGKSYTYGFYAWVVQLVTDENRLEKSLFSLFWGIMTLCTFGNLQSSPHWLEVVFNIVVLTCGLFLVTMLIGNIKVFLNTITSKPQAMKLRMMSIDVWMRKKRLPKEIRERVRSFERQRWAATRGVEESELINDLPEGLRKDIKYHLCWDLVRQVPLFQHMDDQVLEHICDRVKSVAFTKGETISREGDSVQRMIFVVRGHLQSSQELHDGVKSYCMLGPGNFSGDELLSWCLRRPFIERLPPSSSTLVTLETTEAFVLEAWDVKYVTQHFSYTFVKEKVMRSARYYSPGWRTWAAVAIQLGWRRYKDRNNSTLNTSLSIKKPDKRMPTPSMGEDKLRFYAAMLNSQKPGQNDFDFFD
ncbi:hypothetical protein TanjilG_26873 [Lupinus angustifolius]|uniref:Cyclic nucleotide-binding domain-containing protein n=1 Tax=Lupinus angustifolius TaxID=3871 RepID=A0A4P1RJE1_LUPAN|nr:PREDICTED: cyclic nucleotide-gated ion channel 4-like [Lupinus angustifolius]OIW11507.1 hypothetical protein TanjilG_26873 [Lupinus angustifolius]